MREEERAGTRLMLRPCRMHKARTRQKTPKEMTEQKEMDTRKRANKGEEKNHKKLQH